MNKNEDLTLKDLTQKHNVTIKYISERFGIPYHTIQNWSSGIRRCPSYVLRMIDELLSA